MQTPKTVDPALVADGSDELLITDTSGVTKRISVDNFHASAPDATSNHHGYMGTSAQTFAGKKTFNDGIKTDSIDTEEGLAITGDTEITGALETSGGATIGGAASIGGNTSVTGDVSATGDASFGGDVTASGKGTFGDDVTVNADLHVNGNIVQEGQSYETHAEKVYTKNDKIILRDGAQTGLASGDYAGFTAKHYDSDGNDGALVFDNKGEARVGDYTKDKVFIVYSSDGVTFYTDAELTTAATIPAGVTPTATGETNEYSYTQDVDDTEPLATRAETGSMTDGNIVKWNGTKKRIESANFNETDFANKQPKTMSASVTVNGTAQSTVEGAIGAINTYASGIDSAKQPKTLDTPITVAGVSKTTVEAALQAINNAASGKVSSAQNCIIASSTTITSDFTLATGQAFKVLFDTDITGVDTSTGLSIVYNSGAAIPVKVNKNGSLVDFVAADLGGTPNVYKYLQAYTTLELVYDGTNFIIMGNPLVLSGAGYEIYANGLSKYNKYSTNEVFTGKYWIDGKPIYSKVLTGDTLPASGATLLTNVDTLVNCYGTQYFAPTGMWYHFPYGTTTYSGDVIRPELVESTHIVQLTSSGAASVTSKYKWTFEYTKTTD